MAKLKTDYEEKLQLEEETIKTKPGKEKDKELQIANMRNKESQIYFDAKDSARENYELAKEARREKQRIEKKNRKEEGNQHLTS